jgi:hypothetical protein
MWVKMGKIKEIKETNNAKERKKTKKIANEEPSKNKEDSR